MKKTSFAFFAVALGLLMACSDFKVTTTDEGDRIIYHNDEDGEAAKEGEIMMVDLMIKDANDTTYRNSFQDGQPIRIDLIKGGFKGSFENALFHLNSGDSCTILVPADSIFLRMGQGLPPNLKAGTDLKFTVKVREVLSQEKYASKQKELFKEEDNSIKQYVDARLPAADTLGNSGIYLVRSGSPKGVNPKIGDIVSVKYKGYLMNGTVFDQTQEGDGPYQFPVGVNRVIRGWDMTVLSMKKGEKVTVVVPSRLAYGESGAGGVIPPNSPLVFDIELVDFETSK